MNPIRIAINGAAGRMGQRLVALGMPTRSCEFAAALDATGHPQLGSDAGQVAGIGPIGVKLASTLSEGGRRDDRFFHARRRPTRSWRPASRGRFRWCWPRPGWKCRSGRKSTRPHARFRCSGRRA